MELKRDEIIKALECCTNAKPYCYDCILLKDMNCGVHLLKNALALIKELTEENELWQKQLISLEEQSGKSYYDLACEVEDLRAENERLHKNIKTYRGRLKARDKEFDNLNKINILLIENRYGIENKAYLSIVGKEKKIEYRIRLDAEEMLEDTNE